VEGENQGEYLLPVYFRVSEKISLQPFWRFFLILANPVQVFLESIKRHFKAAFRKLLDDFRLCYTCCKSCLNLINDIVQTGCFGTLRIIGCQYAELLNYDLFTHGKPFFKKNTAHPHYKYIMISL